MLPKLRTNAPAGTHPPSRAPGASSSPAAHPPKARDQCSELDGHPDDRALPPVPLRHAPQASHQCSRRDTSPCRRSGASSSPAARPVKAAHECSELDGHADNQALTTTPAQPCPEGLTCSSQAPPSVMAPDLDPRRPVLGQARAGRPHRRSGPVLPRETTNVTILSDCQLSIDNAFLAWSMRPWHSAPPGSARRTDSHDRMDHRTRTSCPPMVDERLPATLGHA